MSEYEERVVDGGEQFLSDTKREVVIPVTQDRAKESFRAIGSAIEQIATFAKNSDSDDLHSSLVYGMRRLKRVFDPAYDTDDIKDYRLPIHGEVFSDINWYMNEMVPPRTITIEQTSEVLRLTYEHGFHATDETIELETDSEDDLLYDKVRNCGKGVPDHHAPYCPDAGEIWRRNTPSMFSFSLEETDTGLRLGIAQSKPEPPLFWYWWYDHLTQIAGPYANPTFKMEDQTSTVRHMAGGYEEPDTMFEEVQNYFNKEV